MRAIFLVASVALMRVATAEQCPAGFEEFIGAFESSAEFQVAHSKYPLSYRYLDVDSGGEPKSVQVAVTRDNLGEFAAVQFPSSAQRAQESIQQAVTAPNAKTRIVRLWLENSDFEIKYVFEKTSACWQLIRVEDGVS
ncbi:hypothetical protein ACFPN2_33740 [Steroidobacter flavus]|uniref:Uncharacterized protein n=1 Tax=Steroidobacter flavus TaxID=1842136 RepID=A0ABV8T4P4_9GAMM